MKNTYNKGKFRSFEYGKIPPYLKRLGNKKWRSTENTTIEEQLSLDQIDENIFVGNLKVKKNNKIKIKAKITYKFYGDITRSEYKKYSSERALQDAIKRNSVIRALLK